MAFGLRVSPSAVLKNLLQNYPSGGQFISEALQNAEDTNRSTSFCAILDLQSHPSRNIRQDHKPWRDRLQGPAFLFYDDGGFADRDWESLQRIYDSAKKHCPSEVGKYGMGSRSFFHIGDVIQIVSGTKYAVLDPDERVSKKGHFGACVDFVHDRFEGKTFFESHPDECAPFRGLLGCTMQSPFKGTIIRVPLRMEAHASESTFMPKAFPVERAKKVLQDFEEELAGGRMALFLPRLQTIKLLFRAPGGGLECKASVSIVRTERKQLGLLDVKAYLQKFQTTAELQETLAEDTGSAPTVYEEIRLKFQNQNGDKETRWVRVGRFFNCRKYLESLPEEVPFVCLAMPMDEPCEGLAFAHLPLPLKTGLPVHLHAGFALQANRRGLWRNSAGLKLDGEHEAWAAWNEHILQAVVPEVYADALKLLQAELGRDKWFGLWPQPELKQGDFQVVVAGLVRLLRGERILQMVSGAWVAPQDAKLLNLPTPALRRCRGDLEALCLKAGMTIVNLPDHVAQLLKDHNAICTEEKLELLRAFIRNSENLDACEVTLKVARSQEAEVNMGRELLTIQQMKDKGFSEMKMQSTIQRGHAVPDPDCPTDPMSTRYWCTVGGSMNEKERTRIEQVATSQIQPTEANLSGLLACNVSAGGLAPTTSQLSLTDGSTAGTPSVSTMLELSNQVNPASTVPSTKAKAKAKVKAKAKAAVQNPRTPDEHRAAIRTLLKKEINACATGATDLPREHALRADMIGLQRALEEQLERLNAVADDELEQFHDGVTPQVNESRMTKAQARAVATELRKSMAS